MKYSKFLRATVVFSMVAGLVGGLAGAALASVHGTFTVTPTSVTPSTANNPFTLDFHTNNAANGGDAPECLIFTLTGFTNVHVTSFSVDSKTWTTSVAGNVVTASASTPADQMGNQEDAILHATADSPATLAGYTWTLDSFTNPPATGCNHANAGHFQETATVIVAHPSTTTVSCTPSSVVVSTASTCTATVAGSFGTPTGTVNWAASGGGVFSPTSCTLASGSCHVTYTPNTTTGSPQTITATYAGNGTYVTSHGSTSLTVTSSGGGVPTKNNTSTTLTCATLTPKQGTADACTVTVVDTGGPNAKSHPTGTVSLTTSGGGTWASASCTLAAAAASDTSACSPVNYTPTASGSQTLTATYGGDTGHNGSSNSASPTTLSVQPTGAPASYQPDGQIRRAVKGLNYKGNNIYNGTGNHQTARGKARRGHSVTFQIRVQNDGNTADTFFISAPGQRPPGFRVLYFMGKTQITSAVAAHTFQTQSLARHAYFTFRAVVHVLKHAPLGTVRAWYVDIRSAGNPTKRDVVKFKVFTPRKHR